MEKTVWKFVLKSGNLVEIEMPKGAEILTTQTQDGKLCIWAVVNLNADKEIRRFLLVGTGDLINNEFKKYVGTFHCGGGKYVFHLFEK